MNKKQSAAFKTGYKPKKNNNFENEERNAFLKCSDTIRYLYT